MKHKNKSIRKLMTTD